MKTWRDAERQPGTEKAQASSTIPEDLDRSLKRPRYSLRWEQATACRKSWQCGRAALFDANQWTGANARGCSSAAILSGVAAGRASGAPSRSPPSPVCLPAFYPLKLHSITASNSGDRSSPAFASTSAPTHTTPGGHDTQKFADWPASRDAARFRAPYDIARTLPVEANARSSWTCGRGCPEHWLGRR